MSRTDYQTRLDTSTVRFDASTQVIGEGGHLYIKKDAPTEQGCLKLCGTIEPKDPADPLSGFKVSLPIGFRVATNTPKVLTGGLITELTYWDPIAQVEAGIPYTYNRSVEVPKVLVSKTINDLEEVRVGFIQGAYVHPTPDGRWTVDKDIPLWREPLGLGYGMTVTVKVTADHEKVAVCTSPSTVLSPTVSSEGILVSNLTKSC
jgi:hypothetical protein